MGGGLTPADRLYLEHALELAGRGARTAAPNPMVGCVLVAGDRIVGEGWHERPGWAHAEVNALHQAGSAAAGATAYLSLEPCAHHGRTPPCADALVAAGVARVVVAAADPDPRVDGRGIERLQRAGIQVDMAGGSLELAARRQNAGFRSLVQRGRPYVTYKAAVSRDGRTAPASRRQTWISSPQSRALVHELRAESGAVAVGIGTALNDDPNLMARDVDPPVEHQPLRVVFDRRGRLDAGSQLARTATALTPVLQMVAPGAAAPPAGVEQAVCENLAAALHELGRRDIAWLLLEGGATIATALLDADLLDRVMVFTAPLELGDGPGLFAREVELPAAWRTERVGADILTETELREP